MQSKKFLRVQELANLQEICYISGVSDDFVKIRSLDSDFWCVCEKEDLKSSLNTSSCKIKIPTGNLEEHYLRGILIDYDLLEFVPLVKAFFNSRVVRKCLGEYLPDYDGFRNSYKNGTKERDSSDFAKYDEAIIVGYNNCNDVTIYLGNGRFRTGLNQANVRHGKYKSDCYEKYSLNLDFSDSIDSDFLTKYSGVEVISDKKANDLKSSMYRVSFNYLKKLNFTCFASEDLSTILITSGSVLNDIGSSADDALVNMREDYTDKDNKCIVNLLFRSTSKSIARRLLGDFICGYRCNSVDAFNITDKNVYEEKKDSDSCMIENDKVLDDEVIKKEVIKEPEKWFDFSSKCVSESYYNSVVGARMKEIDASIYSKPVVDAMDRLIEILGKVISSGDVVESNKVSKPEIELITSLDISLSVDDMIKNLGLDWFNVHSCLDTIAGGMIPVLVGIAGAGKTYTAVNMPQIIWKFASDLHERTYDNLYKIMIPCSNISHNDFWGSFDAVSHICTGKFKYVWQEALSNPNGLYYVILDEMLDMYDIRSTYGESFSMITSLPDNLIVVATGNNDVKDNGSQTSRNMLDDDGVRGRFELIKVHNILQASSSDAYKRFFKDIDKRCKTDLEKKLKSLILNYDKSYTDKMLVPRKVINFINKGKQKMTLDDYNEYLRERIKNNKNYIEDSLFTNLPSYNSSNNAIDIFEEIWNNEED